MANLTSTTLRYLSGENFPGTKSKVKDIKREGNTRVIKLRDGTVIRTTKKKLLESFHRVLSENQSAKAKASLRVKSNGTAQVTIGGAKKGERKTYATEAAAKAAITRHYGKI